MRPNLCRPGSLLFAMAVGVPLWGLAVIAVAQITAEAVPFELQNPPLGPVKLALGIDRVIDGDTVEAKIFLPYGLQVDGTIRALGFDAWESRKGRGSVEVTDAEVVKGKAAARGLQELIDLGEVYAEPEARGKRDVYGRMLARLWVKTEKGEIIDVAKWMREKGHCRPDKGVKAKADEGADDTRERIPIPGLHPGAEVERFEPAEPEAVVLGFGDDPDRDPTADKAAEAFARRLVAAEKAKAERDSRDTSGRGGGGFAGPAGPPRRGR